MKKIFLFATAAIMLAACSSEDELALNNEQQTQSEVTDGAIGFDVYAQKTTTRGGVTGSLTTAGMKDYSSSNPFNTAGFGVFGYYTNNNEYDQRSVPNFMYNQQVKFTSGTPDSWTYKPVVYWPNEYGTNAESDDKDKLTFLAYAPWIKVVPTSGKLDDLTNDAEEWGITGMTRNSNQGDPILKYIASFRADRSVDLCWGVADNNDGQAWNLTETGNPQNPNIENGMPWVDLQRPANTTQKVKFTFKHATAQMRVNIDAEVDEVHGNTQDVHTKTRVWVREVTFKGFAMKGSLNLKNDEEGKAKWLDYNGMNELVAEDVTIYDGRKDGKEGVAGAVATNEKVLGLNPAIVQDGVYSVEANTVYTKGQALIVEGVDPEGTGGSTFQRPGVVTNPVNLFAQDATNANTTGTDAIFHVIPTDDPFEVEIVYDIETVSENLAQNLSDGQTKGSSIENRIRQAITFSDASSSSLEIGKSYTINLHLGMNSVKVDADVTDWIQEAEQPVDLPLNTPIFAAGSPDKAVTIPYVQTDNKYTFALSGLDGGENVTVTSGPSDGWSITDAQNPAWANGYALETVTTVPNFKTWDRTQTIEWTGAQSGIATKINFTQLAHPLFMKITDVDAGTKTITLTRYNDANQTASGHWSAAGGWLCDGDGAALTSVSTDYYIKVWRNGIELDNSDLTTAAAGNKFQFNDTGTATTATITLGDTPKTGDVYKVELKTGDLPAETVSYKF